MQQSVSWMSRSVLYILLRISACPSFQFVLVFIGCARGVLDFRIFTGQGSTATIRLEELGRGLVSTHFE